MGSTVTLGALHTDLYELNMMSAAVHSGIANKLVTFELSVRTLPPERRYLVACGIERAAELLPELRFHSSELEYLAGIPALQPAWTDQVRQAFEEFAFRGELWAVPEGTVVFGREPLVRVTARLFEAQLIETLLLGIVNTETLVASTASRIVQAAGSAGVLEFGARRTSPEEAVQSARAAYLAGFAKTSHVQAGRRYGIPVAGTLAHAWMMAHEREVDAFRNWVDVHGPEGSTLLIDTYDPERGLENALTAAGTRLGAVRLDSGDLAATARRIRQLLDEAGATQTRIVASGDLTAERIAALRRDGAPIDAFGVGTALVRSIDAPALSGVYKLVYDHERDAPVLKTSSEKKTWPGCHQIVRSRDPEGFFSGDEVCLVEEAECGLLERFVAGGERVRPTDSLETSRSRLQEQLSRFRPEVHSLDPAPKPAYPVRWSEGVRELMQQALGSLASD
jgi:nicotinate phosphoribosyltransferase